MTGSLPSAVLACALVAGCGRVHFDGIVDAGDGIGPGDGGDAVLDAAGPTMIVGSSLGLPQAESGIFQVVRPADVVEGDVLYLAMYVNGLPAFTAPPDWHIALNAPDGTAMFRAGFYDRVAGPSEPATYPFSVTSPSVAWVLVVVRNAPSTDADVSQLTVGTAGPNDVTYGSPGLPATAADRLLVMFIDDAGSSGGSPGWNDVTGATKLADAKRVVAYTSIEGPGSVTFGAVVNVMGATNPHGAVRAIAWPR